MVRCDRALWVPERIFVGRAKLLEDAVIEKVVEHLPEEDYPVLEFLLRPSVRFLDVHVLDLDLNVISTIGVFLDDKCEFHNLRQGHGDVVGFVNERFQEVEVFLLLHPLVGLRFFAVLCGPLHHHVHVLSIRLGLLNAL